MFNKRTPLADMEKRLIAARAELAEASTRLSATAAGQDAAVETAATFAEWRADSAAAELEVSRLTQLVAALDAAVIEQKGIEQVETIRKRAAAARKANAALAQRVRIDGVKLSAQLIDLLKEVAASEIEARQINELLPEGDDRVQNANELARGIRAVPRLVLSEKVESLWARAANGSLVGDQDSVIDRGQFGVVPNQAKYGSDTRCVRRSFKVTTFHPAIAARYADSVFDKFDLPRFDAPGSAISSKWRRSAANFAAEASPYHPAVDREIETEIVPVDPWEEKETRGYVPLHNVVPSF